MKTGMMHKDWLNPCARLLPRRACPMMAACVHGGEVSEHGAREQARAGVQSPLSVQGFLGFLCRISTCLLPRRACPMMAACMAWKLVSTHGAAKGARRGTVAPCLFQGLVFAVLKV